FRARLLQDTTHGRFGVLRNCGRIADHVGDIPVDAANPSALRAAVKTHKVPQIGHCFSMVGNHDVVVAEIRCELDARFQRPDNWDIDKLPRNTHAGVVAATHDGSVKPGLLSLDDGLEDSLFGEML